MVPFRYRNIETSEANKSIAKVHGVSFLQTSLRIIHCIRILLRKHGHSIAIALGPFAAALVLAFVSINSQGKYNHTIVAMLAVLIWMIIWWVTEAVPIAITSLLPLLLYPVLGIQNANAVATSYMNDTISLFIGSFILALAVERYQVHRRLALTTLLLIGGKQMDPRLLLLGFCIGPAFVSMWISNTATSIMMMPIAVGVLEKLHATYAEHSASEAGSSESPVAEKLTLIADNLQKTDGGFTGLGLIHQDVEANNSKTPPEESKPEVRCHLQKELSLDFLEDFSGALPGWGEWCTGGLAGDGTASILMAIPLFIIPNKLVPGEKLMSWKHCKNFPWDIVLLLGGGFAIADGIAKSGLSTWMTQHLVFLQSAPFLLMVPIVCLFVGITTEFVSNSSTATIFLPLLIPVALSGNIHPLFYLVPGTIAASYSFMLPIGTPPNAVAYATGYIRMIDMISTGFFLKIFATLVLSAMVPYLGPTIFGWNKPFDAH
ncbi:hypothetical protein O6H91_18G067400 [Diphasiastrum complanatum]|uniref:Uncharacterized protein n=1 Tax=Diphasiastrum complanatum TaxID=34168 RepID=A0ACC2B2C6_DIPCM|nr:hypothetical protein O6H91_18G067400 [Diphasiastrum complanatum]